MSESRDMDAPVTRRELHDALETWAGAIIASIKEELATVEARLSRELRQYVKGNEEELATRLVTVDEHYKDLPARVTHLEAKVLAPPRRRRRAPRSR